jgi:hypothetical protein
MQRYGYYRMQYKKMGYFADLKKKEKDVSLVK